MDGQRDFYAYQERIMEDRQEITGVGGNRTAAPGNVLAILASAHVGVCGGAWHAYLKKMSAANVPMDETVAW